MSIRVTITGPSEAALYDSTTGIAFGRVFSSEYDAHDFLEWFGERKDLRILAPLIRDGFVVMWENQRDGETAA